MSFNLSIRWWIRCNSKVLDNEIYGESWCTIKRSQIYLDVIFPSYCSSTLSLDLVSWAILRSYCTNKSISMRWDANIHFVDQGSRNRCGYYVITGQTKECQLSLSFFICEKKKDFCSTYCYSDIYFLKRNAFLTDMLSLLHV